MSPDELPKPWDNKPVRGLRKLGYYFAIVILFMLILEASAFVVIFPLLFLLERKRAPLSELGFWLVLLVTTLFLIKVFRSLNRRVDILRMEKRCGHGRVLHLPASLFRNFTGIGDLDFEDNGMSLQGRLGPNLLLPLIVLIAINIFFFLNAMLGGGGIVIGVPGAIILIIVYGYLGRKDQSILIQPGNIDTVKCFGPIVTVRFSKSPLSQLRSVRLFISPSFRAEFFHKFDKMFPRLLPEEYSEAAEKTIDMTEEEASIDLAGLREQTPSPGDSGPLQKDEDRIKRLWGEAGLSNTEDERVINLCTELLPLVDENRIECNEAQVLALRGLSFKRLAVFDSALKDLNHALDISKRKGNLALAIRCEKIIREAIEESSRRANAQELFSALKKGNIAKAKNILSNNPILLHSIDEYGATPLHWAVQDGDYSSTSILIEMGSDVNAMTRTGATPLFLAIFYGRGGRKGNISEHSVEKVVKLLIEAGADVNAKTLDGESPLDAAELFGAKNLISILRSHGATE